MIEIHFHCLPGVDDGPASWDEAVALCRAAAAEGTETIIATPHVLREPWINDEPAIIDRLVLELNTRLGGVPAVHAGCELNFRSDLVELCDEERSPVVPLGRGGFVLVELAAHDVPREATSIIYELTIFGLVPVIAHPERNTALMRDPARLEMLLDAGAVAQVTAAAITGEFGAAAQNTVYAMLEKNFVAAVASDAHSLLRRPPRLAAARAAIRRDFGVAMEQALFVDNPRMIAGLDKVNAVAGGAAR